MPDNIDQVFSPISLSLEQQFSLQSFRSQVSSMNHAQAQDFCVSLYEQMMLREEMYKSFLKKEWLIELPTLPTLPELGNNA